MNTSSVTVKRARQNLPAPKTVQFVEIDPPGKAKALVDDTFQYAIWPILAMGQCFGMMPIGGIKCRAMDDEQAAGRLKFRWRSVRVVWALVYLVLGSILTCLFITRMHETGVTAKNTSACIYFITSLMCNLVFFRMATKWKPLMVKWTNTEYRFLQAPYVRGKWRLATKIRLTAVGFFVLTFIDYFIYSAQTFFNYGVKSIACNWNDEDHLRRFFTMENRYIFEKIPFNVAMAILKTIIDIVNQMGSSYGNVFIMLISIGLVTRFRQLNHRLKSSLGKENDELLWTEIRQDYVMLCDLLDVVDVELAPVILLSCATNLFFICVQLLNIFEELPHLANYVYFWFSLLYLIGRTLGVFLSASAIHEVSRVPLDVIKTVGSADWTPEVDRFADQIMGEVVALSGMKFFYLTRKVLLTMIGTILTYELVLLQFAESTKETDDKIESAESGC